MHNHWIYSRCTVHTLNLYLGTSGLRTARALQLFDIPFEVEIYASVLWTGTEWVKLYTCLSIPKSRLIYCHLVCGYRSFTMLQFLSWLRSNSVKCVEWLRQFSRILASIFLWVGLVSKINWWIIILTLHIIWVVMTNLMSIWHIFNFSVILTRKIECSKNCSNCSCIPFDWNHLLNIQMKCYRWWDIPSNGWIKIKFSCLVGKWSFSPYS